MRTHIILHVGLGILFLIFSFHYDLDDVITHLLVLIFLEFLCNLRSVQLFIFLHPLLLQKWRLQAEANDEAERLINSQDMPTEQS